MGREITNPGEGVRDWRKERSVRTPSGARSASEDVQADPCAWGKAGGALLGGLLVISLVTATALTTVPAHADPTPPVFPSQSAVDAARQAAAAKAAEVAAIERRLAGANDRLEALGREAGRAAEAYNGAIYRLELAKAEAAAAATHAAGAQQTVEGQRRQIGRFAVASYQGGGDLARLGLLFTANGPQAVLDSAGATHAVSEAMQGSFLRFTATQVVSNAFRQQADESLAKVMVATEAAAAAKTRAESAEAAQAAAVASMGAERTQQIGRLAALRNTSYQVAELRQKGLEELARQRAAAAAARKAEELRKRAAAKEAAEALLRAEQAARAARGAKKAKAEQAARLAAQAAQDARRSRDRKASEEAARRAEKAAQEAEQQVGKRSGGHAGRPGKDGRSSGDQGAARAAIEFAQRQLGEPYVWGATGPDSWDCSGLTMGAWNHAGVRLPHYSVAQYEQIKKISEDELRAGDLVFWADNAGDPGTIFHVAMYLGGGRIIHAPRTGRPVRVDSIYYWESPDFFGRP
jgi:peptidoglycan DL-endopeptidase CwlO